MPNWFVDIVKIRENGLTRHAVIYRDTSGDETQLIFATLAAARHEMRQFIAFVRSRGGMVVAPPALYADSD